jgi:hypothetical protein
MPAFDVHKHRLAAAVREGLKEGLRRGGFYAASSLALRALIGHTLRSHREARERRAATPARRGPRGPGAAGPALDRRLNAAESHPRRVEVSGLCGTIAFRDGAELAAFRRQYRGAWQEQQYFSPAVSPTVKCM